MVLILEEKYEKTWKFVERFSISALDKNIKIAKHYLKKSFWDTLYVTQQK